PAILRELAPHAHQRHRVGLGAGLEVAVLAREATAREALCRIGRGRTDLVYGIGKEGIAVLDELAEGIISDRANAWRRPFREIDLRHIGGRRTARYQDCGCCHGQYRNQADALFHFRAPDQIWLSARTAFDSEFIMSR